MKKIEAEIVSEVQAIARSVGPIVCNALLGLHALTGCGKFVLWQRKGLCIAAGKAEFGIRTDHDRHWITADSK